MLAAILLLTQAQAVPASQCVTAAGYSVGPVLSGDGKWVVFASSAANLAANDSDGNVDVFLHSRETQETRRLTDDDPAPCGAPAISGDGRWIAYWSCAATENVEGWERRTWRLQLLDRLVGTPRTLAGCEATTERATFPPRPWLSDSAERIAFAGYAGGQFEALLFDRTLGTTECISVGSDGRQADRAVRDVRLSRNGRFAVFCTSALDLASPLTNEGVSGAAGILDCDLVFLRDVERRTTRYASDRALEKLGYVDYREPLVSDDGRFVAYNNRYALAGAARIAIVKDTASEDCGRPIIAAKPGQSSAGEVAILWMSGDGARALVESSIRGLDPSEPAGKSLAYYACERAARKFTFVQSLDVSRALRLRCGGVSVADDGTTIAFASYDDTLAKEDRNGDADVFVTSLGSGPIELISQARPTNR